MPRPYPLHVHISTLFVVLILLVGGTIGGLGYRFSHDMLASAGDDLSQRVSRETRGELEQLFAPARMAAGLLAHDALAHATTLDQRLARLPLLREALSHSPALSSLYLGYPEGDFFFVRRLLDDAERRALDAPDGAQYVVQSIVRSDPPRGEYRYLDAQLGVLRIDDRPDYAAAFDPRSRAWYWNALAAGGFVHTPPYVFFSNRKVGTTLAVPAGEGVVVGADILLETLGQGLAAQKITPASELALLDATGRVIAHEDAARLIGNGTTTADALELAHAQAFGVPVLAAASDWLGEAEEGVVPTRRLRLDGTDWRIGIQRLSPGGEPLYLVVALPERELLGSAYRLRDSAVWITAFIVLLSVPLTWALARGVSGPLRALADEAEKIGHFEFTAPIRVRSIVKEVQALAMTMGGMKRTIRRFLDISTVVAAEADFDRLLPRLLSETLSAAEAEAGVLYLADTTRLVPAAAMRADGTTLADNLPALDLHAPTCAVQRALSGRGSTLVRLMLADRAALGLPTDVVAADHAIVVPLQNRDGHLVGALLLLRDGEAEEALLGFVDALSGSAAVSLETKELIKLQRELFESFVKVIAGAIDAKSPYTGGHCGRVPELAKMLARAACQAKDGAYRDFTLDEQAWEALHLAAWLHDCGKVTTPEYVVDKATKLETLNDRIHEVRTRFEVLKRDAEIDCLKAIAAGEPESLARARLAAELAGLDDDFAFVAECNLGGESMAEERIARLQRIAARTWMRTLDDRIGISHEELARKSRVPASPLPVREPLLADCPEHLFERRDSERIPADNPWGFRMRVPHWLYNRGELHNLSVMRGTLSDEERYKINEHIVQTEIMLRQLTFPRHLRDVPEIAAGHHEKMDGTGYPKRLTGAQMSPLARMMAIADIFEALTAADRPYKKGKTLSEAVAIMARMRDEGHIDPQLFALFLTAGVHEEYARRFMCDAQVDAVDVSRYLDPRAA